MNFKLKKTTQYLVSEITQNKKEIFDTLEQAEDYIMEKYREGTAYVYTVQEITTYLKEVI